MIKRIEENEEKLDSVLFSINELDNALNNFKDKIDDIVILNKYYGSNNWFRDKKAYEKNIIPKIKAGVLSEDTIWNMNDDIKELVGHMEDIISILKNKS